MSDQRPRCQDWTGKHSEMAAWMFVAKTFIGCIRLWKLMIGALLHDMFKFWALECTWLLGTWLNFASHCKEWYCHRIPYKNHTIIPLYSIFEIFLVGHVGSRTFPQRTRYEEARLTFAKLYVYCTVWVFEWIVSGKLLHFLKWVLFWCDVTYSHLFRCVTGSHQSRSKDYCLNIQFI